MGLSLVWMYGYTTSIQSVCSSLTAENKISEETSIFINNSALWWDSKSAISSGIWTAETADGKYGPSRQQVRKNNLCFYANYKKCKETNMLLMLLASRGREQSQREPVAKKQHKCDSASGERTDHGHPGTLPRQRHPPRQRTHSGALQPQWSQPGSFEKYSL